MPENEPLRLFVYGTLKRGFPARERFLSGISVSEAVVSGDIYALSAGYPAIVVPRERIIAAGSADLRADLEQQMEESFGKVDPPDEPLVYGEIVEIDDIEVLRDVDEYEGFDPAHGSEGLYKRVLVAARKPDESCLSVWTYAMDAPEGIHLPDGEWTGP